MRLDRVRWAVAREKIHSADLLAFRAGWSPLSRLIARAGRSDYSHVGMAFWELVCGVPICQSLEMRVFGGHCTSLAKLVDRYPGRIDVYRANPDNRWPEFNRLAAVKAMRECLGQPYGWRNLLRAARIHLGVVIPGLAPRFGDDMDVNGWPHCSMQVSRSIRAGGVDPVRRLGDRLTEPGDLARSLFFEPLFTLIP